MMKVVTQSPKKVEGQMIQLEFIGDLDRAIEKMKRNPFYGSETKEKEQLKCCFLFLCGMPYSKISKTLNMPLEKISNLLNDEHLEDLLSMEYCTLWKLKREQLTLESIHLKVKQAIKVFIEQNGDYNKTRELTGFSDQTLIRYFSAPQLKEILKDEDLYQKFLEIRKKHKESKKRNQYFESQNLKALLEYEQELLQLYMSSRYSYETISEKMGISKNEVITIMEKRAKDVLTPNEYALLKQHITDVSKLSKITTSNKMLISDPNMIAIVKPEITFVTLSEYKNLSSLIRFLDIFENIKICEPDSSFYQLEMNTISNLPRLEPLLKEDIYQNIKQCVEIEKLLLGNQLGKKCQYIIYIVTQLFKNQLDLEQTALKEGISISSLIRILEQDFIQINYGIVVSECIKNLIEQMRNQYQLEKNKTKYYK